MGDRFRKPAPSLDECDRKPRRCLRCGTSFDSEWAGERICRRCKETKSWRDGEALRAQPSKPPGWF
ncbi:MAG: hypothetical protein HY521_10460 [Proteobacteria bacterium]|nr:hypothetical protein [Pseudomonadota bacterium]